MRVKVLVSYSRLVIRATTSGTIKKQMVHIRTSFPSWGSQGMVGNDHILLTNMNSEDLAATQKCPKVEASASGISIRHPTPFSCYFAHDLVASLRRLTKKKVADRARRNAGCCLR